MAVALRVLPNFDQSPGRRWTCHRYGLDRKVFPSHCQLARVGAGKVLRLRRVSDLGSSSGLKLIIESQVSEGCFCDQSRARAVEFKTQSFLDSVLRPRQKQCHVLESNSTIPMWPSLTDSCTTKPADKSLYPTCHICRTVHTHH